MSLNGRVAMACGNKLVVVRFKVHGSKLLTESASSKGPFTVQVSRRQLQANEATHLEKNGTEDFFSTREIGAQALLERGEHLPYPKICSHEARIFKLPKGGMQAPSRVERDEGKGNRHPEYSCK